MKNAAAWIQSLQLQSHPEGGWFREVYRSKETILQQSLPSRFSGDRQFSTAIYFLLEGTDVSAFHRIKQDELWHFYQGSSLSIHVIDSFGNHSVVKLGRKPDAGEQLLAVVEAGSLFGAVVDDPKSYSLVGCTVAPGFDFDDFEMPGRESLLEEFPQHREVIEKFSRD